MLRAWAKMLAPLFLLGLAGPLALIAGFLAVEAFSRESADIARKARLKGLLGSSSWKWENSLCSRFDEALIGRMLLASMGVPSPSRGESGLSDASSAFESWLMRQSSKAGLAGRLRTRAVMWQCALNSCMGAAIGSVCGLPLSLSLALLLCLVGAVLGAVAPLRAVVNLRKARSVSLDAELPQMLEVVALGLRSGLSFDRSFALYCEHFDTPFACDCRTAYRLWTSGIQTREEALRRMCSSYDSRLFERVVEGIVRSLRFGSSLAEQLEQYGLDARAAHRAHVEEQVAKAPVKMMVPTGTLILPAMLLLVLGPVLLRLATGF